MHPLTYWPFFLAHFFEQSQLTILLAAIYHANCNLITSDYKSQVIPSNSLSHQLTPSPRTQIYHILITETSTISSNFSLPFATCKKGDLKIYMAMVHCIYSSILTSIFIGSRHLKHYDWKGLNKLLWVHKYWEELAIGILLYNLCNIYKIDTKI